MTGLGAAAVAVMAGLLLGAPPEVLPVQGALRDNAGAPVAAGTFGMVFRLYDSADGVDALWTEAWPPGADEGVGCELDPVPPGCVDVQHGAFTVLLGTYEPLTPELFTGAETLWLGLSVEGEPELPRRALGSTPYAFAAHHAQVAGSIDCSGCIPESALAFDIVSEVGPQDLPADGLDEISSGVLSNEFTDSFASTQTPLQILDNHQLGISATLAVPPGQVARGLAVHVSLTNSDLSTLHVTVFGPGNSSVVLWDGSSDGTVLDANWPPSLEVAGSLAAWEGKDPGGTWFIEVIDQGGQGTVHDGELLAFEVIVQTLSTEKVSVDGALQFLPHVGEPFPCGDRTLGSVYFEATSGNLMLCGGPGWLRLRACDASCPDAATVACGETVVSSCGDPCGQTGSGISTSQCLLQVGGALCGAGVVDGCGNECGLVGDGLDLSQCPAPGASPCGSTLLDPCGNVCGGSGTQCSPGATCTIDGCVLPGATSALPATSCEQVQATGSASSDQYWIDPDGPGGVDMAHTFCDLDVGSGGWTLVATLNSGALLADPGTATAGSPSLTETFQLPFAQWFPNPASLLVRYQPTGSTVTASVAGAAWIVSAGAGVRVQVAGGSYFVVPHNSEGACIVNGNYSNGYNCDGNSSQINGQGWFHESAQDEICNCGNSGQPFWKAGAGGCNVDLCSAPGPVQLYLK